MTRFEWKKRVLGDGRSLLAAIYVRLKIGVERRTLRVCDREITFYSAPAWFSADAAVVDAEGRYEAPFMEKMIELLKGSKKPIMFDLGAAVGYDALAVRKFTDCELHLFEPDPVSLYYLHRNCDGLDYRLITDPVGAPGVAGTVTLDDYCARTGVAPTLIKMDIEGYEWYAMKGMVETLSRHRPALLIEFHDEIMREQLGFPPAEIDEMLEGLRRAGYRLQFNPHHWPLKHSPERRFDYTWSDQRPNLPHYAVLAIHVDHPLGLASSG